MQVDNTGFKSILKHKNAKIEELISIFEINKAKEEM